MNRNAFFGFLMLIGVIGELFGRVYAGPYYFSLIFWYLGMFIQGTLSIFRIHIPTLLFCPVDDILQCADGRSRGSNDENLLRENGQYAVDRITECDYGCLRRPQKITEFLCDASHPVAQYLQTPVCLALNPRQRTSRIDLPQGSASRRPSGRIFIAWEIFKRFWLRHSWQRDRQAAGQPRQ